MKNGLMGNSAIPQYVKLLSALMLALTYAGALWVYGADLVNGLQVPPVVTFVLGTGVSMAVSVLGLHSGASLAESPPSSVTVTPPPPSTPVAVTVPPPPANAQPAE